MNKNIWGDFQICISVPLTIFALNNTLCKIKLCQTVAEKFSFSELKIEKVFNVRGSLASCLTFRLFLTLDLYQCGPLSLF